MQLLLIANKYTLVGITLLLVAQVIFIQSLFQSNFVDLAGFSSLYPGELILSHWAEINVIFSDNQQNRFAGLLSLIFWLLIITWPLAYVITVRNIRTSKSVSTEIDTQEKQQKKEVRYVLLMCLLCLVALLYKITTYNDWLYIIDSFSNEHATTQNIKSIDVREISMLVPGTAYTINLIIMLVVTFFLDSKRGVLSNE